MQTLVEAEALTRRLPDGRAPLDGLSLSIRAGDRIAVQGPAGSGKTLLLRALAQLDPVDDGIVRWQGEAVDDSELPEFRSRVAYLAQTPALVEGTVETNLRLPYALRVHRQVSAHDGGVDSPDAQELLERLGRDASFRKQPVAALSGGERQIVALVRLLQLAPRVLLLDEPTAALDPETVERAEQLIRSWAAADSGGRAYVWVTHGVRQAEAVASRRLRLERGALVEVG